MPDDNLEIVRSIYAKWERGDFVAAIGFFDPEITFETFMPDSKQPVVMEGVDQIEKFMRDWFEQWRAYRVTGEEFRPAGEDKVLVSGRQLATGRQSGVEVVSPAFTVWTFRDGKVIGLSAHYDEGQALEAAGLSG